MWLIVFSLYCLSQRENYYAVWIRARNFQFCPILLAAMLRSAKAEHHLVLSVLALAANLCFFPVVCMAARFYNPSCPHSSFCGNLTIPYPFRLNTDPVHCGEPGYELVCDDDNRTTLFTKHGTFFVENISPGPTIRLVDAGLERNTNNTCSSVPRSSFLLDGVCGYGHLGGIQYNPTLYVLNCKKPVMMNSSSRYVDAASCTNNSSSPPYYTYFILGNTSFLLDDESCEITAQSPVALFPEPDSDTMVLSASEIYHKLLQGFDVSLNDIINNSNLTSCRGGKVTVTLKDRLRLGVHLVLRYLLALKFLFLLLLFGRRATDYFGHYGSLSDYYHYYDVSIYFLPFSPIGKRLLYSWMDCSNRSNRLG